jgi:hypothetical protein
VQRWSVGVEAEGDRVLTREEIVELADAVADYDGIATGIGTNRYGAQLVVLADSREEAIAKATSQFTQAAAQARLPDYPIVRAEAISEEEDFEQANYAEDADEGFGDAGSEGSQDADEGFGDGSEGSQDADEGFGDGSEGSQDADSDDSEDEDPENFEHDEPDDEGSAGSYGIEPA